MKMFKKDFTHQITNAIPLNAKGQCLLKKNKKAIGLMSMNIFLVKKYYLLINSK